MNRFITFIKYVDIFGQPVNLNYNKKGSFVNSVFGGLISLTVGISCIYLFIVGFVGMLSYQNPQLNVFNNNADMSQIGVVPFKSLNMLFYYKVINVNDPNINPFKVDKVL